MNSGERILHIYFELWKINNEKVVSKEEEAVLCNSTVLLKKGENRAEIRNVCTPFSYNFPTSKKEKNSVRKSR